MAFVLWSHALAALMFVVLAFDQLRRPASGIWPRTTFVVAVVATALWALAVAGIDARDVVTRIVDSVRTIAWLCFMFAIVRRDRVDGHALRSVYVMVMVIAASAALIALFEAIAIDPAALPALAAARLVFRMMAAVSALVLVHHLHQAIAPPARGRIRLVVAALGVMWGYDLLLAAVGYAGGVWPDSLVGLRGIVLVGVALTLFTAAHRSGDWTLAVSRTVAIRSLSAIAIIVYAGMTALLTNLAESFGGPHARIAQTAIVFGATAALLALLSTPWLRAWTKVKVAKHLFRHRYDYRAEWQRFTATLGKPGAEPLDRRIVKAIADLTVSPAGLLLVQDGTGLGLGATWNWQAAGDTPVTADDRLARYLSTTTRIVELDAVRAGIASADEAHAIPDWMLARGDAWAIVPLIHGDALVGAIILARPPVDRALDWEDFDLLRVAGRQAASYLAEDRAHAALADAQRFDEFNRRFAFIMHDIKNLVSQITLVARNAERHADNPDFRTDMVATLQDSADRMNALLARLSQHHATRQEAPQPIDIATLVAQVAQARRAQHDVHGRVDGSPVALAQPGKLEQVLGHLIQNAIEASPPDRAITVAAAMIDGRVAIDVVDRGCGMAPGFVRHQLFRPFVSTKSGGFGIGAFEARQLVQAMNGSITVDSREGEGTRFRILLPMVRLPGSAMDVAA